MVVLASVNRSKLDFEFSVITAKKQHQKRKETKQKQKTKDEVKTELLRSLPEMDVSKNKGLNEQEKKLVIKRKQFR